MTPIVKILQGVPRFLPNHQGFQRWLVSGKASQNHEALLSGIKSLPQAEQVKIAKNILTAAKVSSQAAISEANPKILTNSVLLSLFAATAVPMIGFGFVDNAVMILAGEVLEIKLGAALGISTLAAAGFGNLVSDVVGLGAGGAIETAAARVGLNSPKLSPSQLNSGKVVLCRNFGSVFGISLGCLIGMFPLMFYDEEESRLALIFKRYDINQDGSLDREELRQAFAEAKVYFGDSEIQFLMDKYDTDQNGTLCLDEFKELIREVEKQLKENPEQDAQSLLYATATSVRNQCSRK